MSDTGAALPSLKLAASFARTHQLLTYSFSVRLLVSAGAVSWKPSPLALPESMYTNWFVVALGVGVPPAHETVLPCAAANSGAAPTLVKLLMRLAPLLWLKADVAPP